MSVDMMVRRRVFTLAFCGVVAAVQLMAAPVPLLDVRALEADATLIVAGRVLYVIDAGPVTANTTWSTAGARYIEAEIAVDRTLKGDPARSVRVRHIQLSAMNSPFEPLLPNAYRLFFLKPGATTWEPVSPYYSSLVASEAGTFTSATPLERVAQELGCVLTAPSSTVWRAREAVGALASIQDEAATPTLRVAVHHDDAVVRATALGALIHNGDATLFPAATQLLLNGQDEDVRVAVSRGLFGGHVPTRFLARLLDASNVETRRAAARALRNVRSPEATAALVKALADADRDVQYLAVSSLAEMTEQWEWAPSRDTFERDPQHYLSFWSEWSSRNHRQ